MKKKNYQVGDVVQLHDFNYYESQWGHKKSHTLKKYKELCETLTDYRSGVKIVEKVESRKCYKK